MGTLPLAKMSSYLNSLLCSGIWYELGFLHEGCLPVCVCIGSLFKCDRCLGRDEVLYPSSKYQCKILEPVGALLNQPLIFCF